MSVPRFRVTERHILLFILFAAILGYGGAVLFINVRKKVTRADAFRKPIVRWMPPQPTQPGQEIHYAIADLLDPSLMSVPNAHGFSHSMWQRQMPAPHRVVEPPAELAFLDAEPAHELPALLQQPSLVEAMQATTQKLPAESEEAEEIKAVEPPRIPEESMLRIIEGLQQRPIIVRPTLPRISGEPAPRPTRVRVGVASDGTVHYAMLERSCGNENVDARALDAARRVRFEPQRQADDEVLNWGVILFLWATATPPATNGTSAVVREQSHNQ